LLSVTIPNPYFTVDSGLGSKFSQARARGLYQFSDKSNKQPVELNEFIATIETIMGKPARKNLLPMQPGDVVSTYADVQELITDFDFQPSTSIAVGLEKFVSWYQEYYQVASRTLIAM
jgi:UDP-glucuronate 4-epimerase